MLSQTLISNNYPAKEISYKMANAKAEAIPGSQSCHDCIIFKNSTSLTTIFNLPRGFPKLSKVANLKL